MVSICTEKIAEFSILQFRTFGNGADWIVNGSPKLTNAQDHLTSRRFSRNIQVCLDATYKKEFMEGRCDPNLFPPQEQRSLTYVTGSDTGSANTDIFTRPRIQSYFQQPYIPTMRSGKDDADDAIIPIPGYAGFIPGLNANA